MAGRKRQDEDLVLALARGITITDAAAQSGLSQRTVNRRMKDAEFRCRVQEARGDLYGRAVGLLADACRGAIGTLNTLQSSAESESVRCMAARAVLEHAVRYREHSELAARLETLEQAHNAGFSQSAETLGNDPSSTRDRKSVV
jgi:hypothetical protein